MANTRHKRGGSIQLHLTRRVGAPASPTQSALSRLLALALKLAEEARLPDSSNSMRLTVDILLVDDEEINALNVSHLKHTGPTDVLSFPLGEFDPERNAWHLGEIVASFQTAEREAQARGLPLDEELNRYCVHGFLHLLGYDDATQNQRKELEAIQERAVSSLRRR